mmetsp:Transcript_40839/g.86981  ORF Transcript_40839/g.86981 Transcript_40839/m.86981 type:complete len:238 (+) Transcript_40839:470-1183(+)
MLPTLLNESVFLMLTTEGDFLKASGSCRSSPSTDFFFVFLATLLLLLALAVEGDFLMGSASCNSLVSDPAPFLMLLAKLTLLLVLIMEADGSASSDSSYSVDASSLCVSSPTLAKLPSLLALAAEGDLLMDSASCNSLVSGAVAPLVVFLPPLAPPPMLFLKEADFLKESVFFMGSAFGGIFSLFSTLTGDLGGLPELCVDLTRRKVMDEIFFFFSPSSSTFLASAAPSSSTSGFSC